MTTKKKKKIDVQAEIDRVRWELNNAMNNLLDAIVRERLTGVIPLIFGMPRREWYGYKARKALAELRDLRGVK